MHCLNFDLLSASERQNITTQHGNPTSKKLGVSANPLSKDGPLRTNENLTRTLHPQFSQEAVCVSACSLDFFFSAQAPVSRLACVCTSDEDEEHLQKQHVWATTRSCVFTLNGRKRWTREVHLSLVVCLHRSQTRRNPGLTEADRRYVRPKTRTRTTPIHIQHQVVQTHGNRPGSTETVF